MMKTLFLILFFVFSMGAKAQLAYELSYERKTRTVSLRLENKFDEIVSLRPAADKGPLLQEGSYFAVKYKDAFGKVLYACSQFIFHGNGSTLHMLAPKAKQIYTFNLLYWLNSSVDANQIESVEINVHLGCRGGKNFKCLFMKDILESYKWNE